MPDLNQLLSEAAKDLMTPETLSAIEEAVKTKAESLAKLQVEAALNAQDEKHAQMLTQLLERTDSEYANKLSALVNKLDEA